MTSTGWGGHRRPGGRIAVAPPSSVKGRPHSGQKRLSAGTEVPQWGQSRTDVLALRMSLFPRRIEGAQRLGCLAPKRSDELAVVGVGDLAGAVVELQLLQRRERPVALFGYTDALTVLRRELGEPVVLRRRLAEEGARDERHARDGEENRKDHGG